MKKKLLGALTLVLLMLLSVTNFAQAPPLGTAADFVLFSTVGAVGNTGISQITGNVGTNSGAITGFGNVNGVMNTSNGATGQCAADLLIAYNQLNSTIPNFFPAPLLGNGQLLGEGVYAIAGPATLNNGLTLDAQDDPDAVFIFQINGAFSTSALSSVTLINGAKACNVFWKIEGLVDMASGTTMRGTIIANNGAINMNSDGVLEGRALSTSGAVNVSGVLAYTPIGCGSPLLMGPAAPDLVSAACYAIFSSDGPVSNAGITYVVGDVGTNVGLTTGFNPLFVTGMVHPIPDGSTAAAAADLLNAYNFLNTLPFDIELLYPAQFGNDLVLTPHTYLLNAATTFTGDLYLNAGGQEDAVFVIQINGALTTSTYANVILMDGTKPENVFWKVDGAVAVNDYSNFVGTIIANNGAVDLTTGVILEGRAFTTTGALSTASVTVTMPPGCGSVSSPEIISGPEDQTVCENGMVNFSVSATGTGLTYQWRRGTEDLVDGLSIFGATTNELTINPVLLSDAASDYNVVVTGTYPPAVTSENASLFVQLLPTNVFAGDDATTCETCPFTLSNATAENYSSLLWTTTGDGVFDDETDLNATYTPGLTDPGTVVTLCLHVNQIAPCEGLPYVDCVDLFVQTELIEPVANAGEDQGICEDQVANLVGEAENYSSVMWSGGDGVFSAPNSLITDYTPGPGDILAGTAELCLTAELIVFEAVSDVDCLILTIYSLPTVNAGDDATTCETCPFTLLGATAENFSSLLWTTTGDGVFDDETDLNATYTPGLTDPGTVVTLCLNVNQIAPCEGLPYADCMDLFVETEVIVPVANAGQDQEICENMVASLAGDAQNYTSVMWSGGDGVFSAPNSLITDYTPGPADIFAGTVQLCLTAELIGGNPASDVDCLMLTISTLPAVNAGNDATICETQIFETNPTLTNYSQIYWTTTGDGYFDNETAEITNYHPGTSDLLNGQVYLCIMAFGFVPCVTDVTDCMILYFEDSPTAFAGNDVSVCEGDNAQLNGIAENYSDLLWTTTGTGVFNDATILNPVYTPGVADISAGTVEICLTATSAGACALEEASDCLILNIVAETTISGLDPERTLDCSDYDLVNHAFLPLELFPDIENATSIIWTSNGDGTFNDPTVENAVYNPGAGDLWNGGFTLCVEAKQDACSFSAEACIHIIVPVQIIPIQIPSWNGISSYVDKSAFTVPQVMAPVVNELIIMVNKAGKYYWPKALPINQLGNWLPIGYKAKFNSTCCLPLYGQVVANQTFTVDGGNTFLPVLTNVPTNIETLLGADAGKVLIVYDWASGMIWTNDAADFNTLEPGKAYLLVKKSSATSFNVTFPEYNTGNSVDGSRVAAKGFAVVNSPWNEVVNTSQPHIMMFGDGAINEMQAGDILGAFNEDGICTGVSKIESNDNLNKLIVMGNDPSSDEINGYEPGEMMNFKLYRPETGAVYDVDFTYNPDFPNSDGKFEVNGVSGVINVTMAITSVNNLNDISNINVFPNPARAIINITSDQNFSNIKLINLTGQLAIDYEVNGNETSLDVSKFVNGLYFLQIETTDGVITTKRIVIE